MNLLWRDNFGSFLDASAPDANSSSASFTDSGATAGLAGQSLLWPGNDSRPTGAWDVNTFAAGGFDGGTSPSSGSLVGQDVLWATPGYAAVWPVADSAGDIGAAGLANMSLPFTAGSMPSDAGSLVWQTMLSRFEDAVANSSTLDATLNQILDVLWTATGGTGSPSVTSLHAPTNPFVNSFPTDPSQLVWTGEPPSRGGFPDGTGQTPLAPPVTGDSVRIGGLPAPTFATLAPQELVWTDPSQGVATTLADQPNVGATPLPTLFSRA
jgi:hypothetical protein